MNKFLDRYKTDRVAEEDGQWVDFGDGIRVKVRRLNSAKSKEIRRKLEKPYVNQFRNRDYPESLQEELMNKQLSQAIVVDWEGVPNPANPDELIPCNEANVLVVLSSFPDFREEIVTASLERATFLAEVRKEGEGNSSAASAGS